MSDIREIKKGDNNRKQELAPLKEIPIQPSTIETIDYSIYDWVNETLNLHATTADGWKKVDVIWVSAERSYQTKRKQEERDSSGTVNYPLIMIDRKSITKDLSRKGMIYGNISPVNDEQGGVSSIVISRRIQQDKTSNFANNLSYNKTSKPGFTGQINFPRKNPKIVYETISIPIPTYVEAMYSILLRTQYQQQMNELVQPFINRPGGINYQILKRDGHRFEAFIDQEFANEGNSNDLGEEERKYEIKISVKVLAYLIGEGKNADQPKIVIRENAVEVKFPRERIVVGDVSDHTDRQGYIGIDSIKRD